MKLIKLKKLENRLYKKIMKRIKRDFSYNEVKIELKEKVKDTDDHL